MQEKNKSELKEDNLKDVNGGIDLKSLASISLGVGLLVTAGGCNATKPTTSMTDKSIKPKGEVTNENCSIPSSGENDHNQTETNSCSTKDTEGDQEAPSQVSTAKPEKNHQAPPRQVHKEENTIKIRTAEELKEIIARWNSGETFENKIIKLENDIYLTGNNRPDGGVLNWKLGAHNFREPRVTRNKEYGGIISPEDGFKGIFDGNGKSLICNINTVKDVFLFGRVGVNGVFKNLNIKGRINSDNSIALVHSNCGIIENVNTDTILTSGLDGVSGLCSNNLKGVIKNCEIKTNINGKSGHCAGICDNNNGTIINCKVSGNIAEQESQLEIENGPGAVIEVGGITSFNYGVIKGCTFEGNISTTANNEGCCRTAAGLSSTNNGLIEDSFVKGKISSLVCAGGLVGGNYGVVKSCKALDVEVNGKYASEFTQHSTWGNEEQSTAIQGMPWGAVIDCEFTGKVIAENAMCNYFSGVDINEEGEILASNPDKKPQLTNCKINGKNADPNITIRPACIMG